MSFLAVAEGRSAAQLLSAVAPCFPGSWPSRAQTTEFGAVVTAGDGVSRVGSWLIVGQPQADPWGIPATPVPAERVVAELSRYGVAALQLSAGPFVAADVDTGTVGRPLNGIVPLFVSTTDRWAASTSHDAVERLTGCAGQPLLAGSLVRGDGQHEALPVLPGETVRALSWRGIDAEIRARLNGACTGTSLPLAVGPGFDDDGRVDDVWTARVAGFGLYLPRLGGRRTTMSLTGYLRLREERLPRLWWRARLTGHWLCAPAFERPAADLISQLSGENP